LKGEGAHTEDLILRSLFGQNAPFYAAELVDDKHENLYDDGITSCNVRWSCLRDIFSDLIVPVQASTFIEKPVIVKKEVVARSTKA